MTKQLMPLLDSTLASTGRTVRAVVLILTVAIATGTAPTARELRIPHDNSETSSLAGPTIASLDRGRAAELKGFPGDDI